MFWKILLCAVAAGLVVVFLWSLRGSLLLPVRCGRNTRLELRLRISGPEPALEETLCALVWLRENGTLKCPIVVEDCGMDEETRQTAGTASASDGMGKNGRTRRTKRALRPGHKRYLR